MGVEKISQDLLEVNTGEVEHSVGEVEDSVGEVEDSVGEVEDSVGEVEDSVKEVEDSVGEVEGSVGEVEDTGGEVKSVFTAKDFRSLQDKTENIRNMSVHGHTYHGKTRVTSCLLEKVLYSLF